MQDYSIGEKMAKVIPVATSVVAFALVSVSVVAVRTLNRFEKNDEKGLRRRRSHCEGRDGRMRFRLNDGNLACRGLCRNCAVQSWKHL